MTFPVVAPLNVLALPTVIVASLAVIACAAIPENFSLDPTAPLLLIMVFNELKSPVMAVIFVRSNSAVPPPRALISVLKVVKSLASPIAAASKITTTRLI